MKNPLHKTLCGIKIPLSFQSGAQDIYFSRFFASLPFRNPALDGILTGDLRLESFRSPYWQSVTLYCQTISFDGEAESAVGKFYKSSTTSFYSNTNVVMTPIWVYSTATTDFIAITVADHTKQQCSTKLNGGVIVSYRLGRNGGFEPGIANQKYLKRDNTSKDAVRCPRF